MRRSKIKQKYLTRIKPIKKSDTNNIIDTLEKKIIKLLISLMWMILLIFWSYIPFVVLNILGINLELLSDSTVIIVSFINDILFLAVLFMVYHKDLRKDFKNYFNSDFQSNLKQSISYWLAGFGIMVISNYIIAIIMNGQLAENEESVRTLIQTAPLYMTFQLISAIILLLKI